MDYIYHFFMFLDKKVYLEQVYIRIPATTQRVERYKKFKVTLIGKSF